MRYVYGKALEEMYTKMIKDSLLPDEIVYQLNFWGLCFPTSCV